MLPKSDCEENDEKKNNKSSNQLDEIVEVLKIQSRLLVNLLHGVEFLKKWAVKQSESTNETVQTNSTVGTIGDKFVNATDFTPQLNTKMLTTTQFKIIHIEGLPRMRITNLKAFIADVCKVERDIVANIGYINDEIVEVVLHTNGVKQFINSFTKNPKFKILSGLKIIKADKEAVLRRLKRVESDRVKNAQLKSMYKELQIVLSDEYCTDTDIEQFTIDEYVYGHISSKH